MPCTDVAEHVIFWMLQKSTAREQPFSSDTYKKVSTLLAIAPPPKVGPILQLNQAATCDRQFANNSPCFMQD
jgi:hypothetical protein